jgi:hypothetical protein
MNKKSVVQCHYTCNQAGGSSLAVNHGLGMLDFNSISKRLSQGGLRVICTAINKGFCIAGSLDNSPLSEDHLRDLAGRLIRLVNGSEVSIDWQACNFLAARTRELHPEPKFGSPALPARQNTSRHVQIPLRQRREIEARA